MSLFAWKPEYSVGNVQIDSQHKQLFQMADDLHSAMVGGRGRQVIEQLLDKLIAYTRFHFTSEEGLMKESGYPDFPRHHELHEKLTKQVVDFQQQVKSGQSAVTVSIMQFLRDWLDHHIKGDDMKVGAHIRSRVAAHVR